MTSALTAAVVLHAGTPGDLRIELLALGVPVALWILILCLPRFLRQAARIPFPVEPSAEWRGDEPI